MQLTVRRKVIYLLAAAVLALMLFGATISAPVFADCSNASTPVCGSQ